MRNISVVFVLALLIGICGCNSGLEDELERKSLNEKQSFTLIKTELESFGIPGSIFLSKKSKVKELKIIKDGGVVYQLELLLDSNLASNKLIIEVAELEFNILRKNLKERFVDEFDSFILDDKNLIYYKFKRKSNGQDYYHFVRRVEIGGRKFDISPDLEMNPIKEKEKSWKLLSIARTLN